MTKRHILLVDDEEGMRLTLAANLEMEGFEVVEAASGEEALAIAGTRDFDLVLTDIRMPGMNGVELFRALRERKKEWPLVLMTAFADESLIAGALEEGAFTMLSKPFDVDHALDTVTRAVSSPAVLVVDDTESVAQSTSAALQAVGVRAQAAFSGDDALAALRSGEIDLCVVDLVMPKLAGPELASQLRQIDPKLSIIAMSGHDVPELIRQVAAMGMHTFFRKPFAMKHLIRAIALARGKPPARGDAKAKS